MNDPNADETALCPECHRDIEQHDQADDGDGYWCGEEFVPDEDVLTGSDARDALRQDAEDRRLSDAGL